VLQHPHFTQRMWPRAGAWSNFPAINLPVQYRAAQPPSIRLYVLQPGSSISTIWDSSSWLAPMPNAV
jgi:hypothetical protein